MGTGTQGTGDANGDLNVDATDYNLWKAAFGTMPGSGALAGNSAVPEPTALALFFLGIIAVPLGRRRR